MEKIPFTATESPKSVSDIQTQTFIVNQEPVIVLQKIEDSPTQILDIVIPNTNLDKLK